MHAVHNFWDVWNEWILTLPGCKDNINTWETLVTVNLFSSRGTRLSNMETWCKCPQQCLWSLYDSSKHKLNSCTRYHFKASSWEGSCTLHSCPCQLVKGRINHDKFHAKKRRHTALDCWSLSMAGKTICVCEVHVSIFQSCDCRLHVAICVYRCCTPRCIEANNRVCRPLATIKLLHIRAYGHI